MNVETNSGQGATVLVDATSLSRRMKGVGRYAWHLCESLSRELPAEADLVLVAFEGELPDFPPDFRGRWIRLPYCSGLRLGLWVFPRLIRETGAGVFIRPSDVIGWRYAVPTLTVCHDVNPLIWAAQFPKPGMRRLIEWFWDKLRGQALRQSSRVICNSEFVRQEAIRHFGLLPGKTSVGYCGVDIRIPLLASRTDQAELRRRLSAEYFLLAFATGDEREGYQILPELWAAAQKAGYGGKLVIAGLKDGSNYALKLHEAFRSTGGMDKVVWLPFLGEEKLELLAGLYRTADFYLETSRHEGFGMQLAEAMACGTTCFSSGRGALNEVGGGFALPLDIDSPTTAGQAVTAAWRADLHQRDNTAQMNHARNFNWRNTCDQVVHFAQEHIGRPEQVFRKPVKTKIITNADDLGVSLAVNDAIFELMGAGRVTSATLLSNGTAVADAANRLVNFPKCSFGVHLNLTQFKPLSQDPGLSPILNAAGEFNSNRIREIKILPELREAIFHEWMAQIERLRGLGVDLSHIDSHHHVHTIPALFPVLKRLQQSSGIRRVRLSMNFYEPSETSRVLLFKKWLWNTALQRYFPTATTQGFTGFSTFINNNRAIAARFETIELMVHPGGQSYAVETDLLRGDWLSRLTFPAERISYWQMETKAPLTTDD